MKMKLAVHCIGKGDMLSFLLNLLLPVYIVISLGFVISHAKAIEHPRGNRGLNRPKDSPIHVSVRPKTDLDFYPGDEVIVACKAKGGKRTEETPFISFFRENGNTHMQLVSGYPGLTLIPHSDSDNDHRVKTVLKLDKNFWYLLDNGPNIFYCKASNMLGNTGVSYFEINKRHHPTNRRNPRWPFHHMHYSKK